MSYSVEHNWCNCHPETCCCDPWKVVDENGNRVSACYRKQEAEHIAHMFDAKEELERQLAELTAKES